MVYKDDQIKEERDLIQTHKIAFVSTRIAGHDGVSLETGKWANILERMGHECFYVAGECDRLPEKTEVIPEAHFKHPQIAELNEYCFSNVLRSPRVGSQIHDLSRTIKGKLKSAFDQFNIDLVIAENCLTIPMNIPLGLALVELIMETGLGCIAHHHDFVWERERFFVNAIEDHLAASFPPSLPQIQHVVINSMAAREFSRRCGLPCRIIPNIMDFDNPPEFSRSNALKFRRAICLKEDDLMFLQPTRLVARKGIEHSIELLHHLEDSRCKLVISHASGDEGNMYAERIIKYAKALKVQVIFADELLTSNHGMKDNEPKLFTIADAYDAADFVTYPSTYEGFGNAFLEAIYYKKPILCNRYVTYRTDIEPCGFKVVLMDGYLTDVVVQKVRNILSDKDSCEEIVDHNYEVATRFFSYRRATDELRTILAKPRMTLPLEDKNI